MRTSSRPASTSATRSAISSSGRAVRPAISSATPTAATKVKRADQQERLRHLLLGLLGRRHRLTGLNDRLAACGGRSCVVSRRISPLSSSLIVLKPSARRRAERGAGPAPLRSSDCRARCRLRAALRRDRAAMLVADRRGGPRNLGDEQPGARQRLSIDERRAAAACARGAAWIAGARPSTWTVSPGRCGRSSWCRRGCRRRCRRRDRGQDQDADRDRQAATQAHRLVPRRDRYPADLTVSIAAGSPSLRRR